MFKSREVATWLGVAGTVSLLMGCTGILRGGSDSGSSTGNSGFDGNNATGSGAGSGSVAGSGSAGGSGNGTGGSGPGVVEQGTDPGSVAMHRLNDVEYNYSVQDALGVTQAPADWSKGQGELYGFDNIAELLGMDTSTYKKFYNAASSVADEVMSTPALKAAFITCNAADAACQQTVMSQVGLKLFRRPLSQDELGTYGAVLTAAAGLGYSAEDSLKAVLRSMLSSAEFLYRIELDPTPNSLTPHALDPYELASRLSYFLWSSGPDQGLLDSAASGKLSDAAELGAQTDRLLADPKGQRFVMTFGGQWLSIDQLPAHAVDTGVFPSWKPAITTAEMEEAYRYFNEFVRGAQPWSQFLKADFNFVNADLAQLYGMNVPNAGATLQPVQVADDNRAGFLGLGAFLTVSSYNYRTSPTLRARRILDQIMCSPPSPPPPGLMIPPLDGDSGTAEAAQQNIRQRLEMHRKNPVCAACHATFDEVGLALENFDAVGQYRATYPDGSTIDASGTVDGTSFDGLAGLSDMLSNDPRFMTCVADKMFIYSLGRGIKDTDRPYIDNVVSAWQSPTAVLPALIKGLVLADTFRNRHAEAQ